MKKISIIGNYIYRHRLMLTFVLAMSFVLFIGDDSVKQYISLSMRVNKLHSDLEKEIEITERDSVRLSNLESSYEGLEHVAREKYFMKRSNEDIYVMSIDQ